MRGMPTERFNLFERLPKVTLVFCCVEGARQYTTFFRKCTRNTHRELVAMMCSVLRQVRRWRVSWLVCYAGRAEGEGEQRRRHTGLLPACGYNVQRAL